MPESTAELNTGESEGGEEINSAPPPEATSKATLDEEPVLDDVTESTAELMAAPTAELNTGDDVVDDVTKVRRYQLV